MKRSRQLKFSPRIFRGFLIAAVATIGCALLGRQSRPGTTFRDCDGCPEMVVISAGSFFMGDSLYGRPQHRVTIDRPFAIAKDMVTRDEYALFVAESGYSANNEWQDAGSRPHGYDGAPGDGSAWEVPQCGIRVMRGTPWFMTDPTPLRSSYRNLSNSSNRSEVISFRVARDL